jgi:hypothetical protein
VIFVYFIIILFVIFGSFLVNLLSFSFQKHREILKPLSRVVCYCFCKRGWLRKHLANEWLAGTWFILWATVAATFGCFILFIAALAQMKGLQIFLMGTT